MKDLLQNNQIFAHLMVNWSGSVVGYNLGYYLSGMSRCNKTMNGIATGVGLGITCNGLLHYYLNYYDNKSEEKKVKNNKQNKKDDELDLGDNIEFIIDLIND